MGDENQQQQQQQTPNPDPKAGTWYGDPKYQGVVEAKGWKGIGDVFESYTNLERVARTPANRTVVIPEKEDDVEGWKQLRSKLGVPEKPTEYKLEGFEPVEGVPDLIQGDDGFLAVAHREGLTQRQVQNVYKWYAGKAESQGAESTEALAEAHTADLKALEGDWGNAYESNVKLAKYAAGTLGVSQEQLEKLENTLGTRWLMETFHKIGQGMTREPGPGPSQDPLDQDPSNGFGVTPAAAQAKIEELMNDPAFYKRYVEGGKAEFDRITKLTEAAAGRGLAGRGRVQR